MHLALLYAYTLFQHVTSGVHYSLGSANTMIHDKAFTACMQASAKLTDIESHLLALGPCCVISAPSKFEQCSVRIAAGLLMAKEAQIALHSLTSLSICT